jgi:hypothetical protein
VKGIEMHNIGTPVSGGYLKILVGDGTLNSGTGRNLMDNLQFGIYALDANLTVQNSSFSYMTNYDAGSAGIYTNAYSSKSQLAVNKLGSNGPVDEFYNCFKGVESNNYYDITGQYALMMSDHLLPVNNAATGQNGYIVTTKNYTNVNLSYNNITNIRTGISFATPFVSVANSINANVNLLSNNIQAATSSQYVELGISANNTIVVSKPFTVTGNVNISGNYLTSVFKGIYVNGFNGQHATSGSNVIATILNPSGGAQFGIEHCNSNQSVIINNTISGTLAGSGSYVNNNWKGIWAASNNPACSVYCNTTRNVGLGFQFDGTQPQTIWTYNDMKSEGLGYFLNSGVIGPQNNGLANMNTWTSNGGHLYGPINKNTYALLSTATNSKLYCFNSTPMYYPTFNLGTGTSTYNFLGARVITGAPAPYPCGIIRSNDDHLDWHGAELTAKLGMEFGGVEPLNEWMAQFGLWQAMLQDTTLPDSSDLLQEFMLMGANSRFKYLTDLENLLADENYDDAQHMLDVAAEEMPAASYQTGNTGASIADVSDADGIIANYLHFYQLYMSCKDSVAGNDSADLAALAGLCPYTNGAVIYQARALYSMRFSDPGFWNDDDCMPPMPEESPASVKSKQSDLYSQAYTLYPNPTPGSFVLQQKISDDCAVTVKIFDVAGKQVYSGAPQFSSGKGKVDMGEAAVGLYLLQLTETNGAVYIIKFMVAK